MDIGKALSYITEDPRWKEKVAIGTGVILVSGILTAVLIGIVGLLIATGYMVRLLQNVRDGHPQPLPEWDQWGEDLVRGLKLTVVALVWSLPMILFTIPMTIGAALADGGGAGEFIGSVIIFGGSCLVALYGIFIAIAQASFTIAFAEDEKISSGLRVREIWDWTVANIGQLVIVALAYIVVSIGVSLVGSIVGVLLCLIGLIVTLPLAQLVIYLFQYHLYGQLAAAYPMSGVTGPRDWSGDPAGGAAAGAATGAGFAAASDVSASTTSDSAVTGSTSGSTSASTSTEADIPVGTSTFDDNPYAAYGPPGDLDESALGTPADEAPDSVDAATAEATGVSLDDETTLAATATPETTASQTTAMTGESADVPQSETSAAYPESGIVEEGRISEETGIAEDTEAVIEADENKASENEADEDKNKPSSA